MSQKGSIDDIKNLEAQKGSLIELTKTEEIKEIREKTENKQVIPEDSMGIDSKEEKDKMVNKVNKEIANLESLKKEYANKYEWKELQRKIIEVNGALMERHLVLDVIEQGSIEPILSKIDKEDDYLSKLKEEYKEKTSMGLRMPLSDVKLIKDIYSRINNLVELTQTEEVKKIQEKVVQRKEDSFIEGIPVNPADLLWIDRKTGKVMEEDTGRTLQLRGATFIDDPEHSQVILKGKSYGKEIQTELYFASFVGGEPFQFSQETVAEVAKRRNEMYHEQQLIQKERT